MYPATDLPAQILPEYPCEAAPPDLRLDDARAILTLHGTHTPHCAVYMCALARAATVVH